MRKFSSDALVKPTMNLSHSKQVLFVFLFVAISLATSNTEARPFERLKKKIDQAAADIDSLDTSQPIPPPVQQPLGSDAAFDDQGCVNYGSSGPTTGTAWKCKPYEFELVKENGWPDSSETDFGTRENFLWGHCKYTAQTEPEYVLKGFHSGMGRAAFSAVSRGMGGVFQKTEGYGESYLYNYRLLDEFQVIHEGSSVKSQTRTSAASQYRFNGTVTIGGLKVTSVTYEDHMTRRILPSGSDIEYKCTADVDIYLAPSSPDLARAEAQKLADALSGKYGRTKYQDDGNRNQFLAYSKAVSGPMERLEVKVMAVSATSNVIWLDLDFQAYVTEQIEASVIDDDF